MAVVQKRLDRLVVESYALPPFAQRTAYDDVERRGLQRLRGAVLWDGEHSMMFVRKLRAQGIKRALKTTAFRNLGALASRDSEYRRVSWVFSVFGGAAVLNHRPIAST